MKRLANFTLLPLLISSAAWAQQPLPSLEVGVGIFTLSAPDFRGSSNTDLYVLPTPYFKYRGERLRVDEGAQGIFWESEDFSITLSGNLSLPVDDDTPERQGMDELDALIEIGPAVNYRLTQLQRSAWWLDLPLRFAYTLNSDLENVGVIFQPRLSWRKPAQLLGQWKLRFNTGPVYSSSAHHAYFYSVSPAEATSTRPAFDAPGGFSGWRSEFTFSKRIGDYWLGGFLSYDDLQNSKFEDSPLVSRTDAVSVGIALAWVFHQRQ